MLVRLRVIRGKANKEAVVVSLPAVIGRSREADLTVIHPMISRRHCELFEQDGAVKVRDLGSLNGTYVAGEQVQEATLPQGSVLTVGPLFFRVEYDLSPAASRQDPSKLRGQTVRVCTPDIVVTEHVADSDSPSNPVGILSPEHNTPPAGEPATEPANNSRSPQDSVSNQARPEVARGIAPPDGALPDFSSLPPAGTGRQGELASGDEGTSEPHSRPRNDAHSSASGNQIRLIKGADTGTGGGGTQAGTEKGPASAKTPWSDNPPPFTLVKPKEPEGDSPLLLHDVGTEETQPSATPTSDTPLAVNRQTAASAQPAAKAVRRWWPFHR